MCKANKCGQATTEWVDNPKFYYQKFDITCRTIAYRINIDLVLTDGSSHELSTNRFKRKIPHGSTDEHVTIFGMLNITGNNNSTSINQSLSCLPRLDLLCV